jgi:uncharacterized RDD family membrane protein YckC
MSGLQDDWYVAGPDGEAIGPLSRLELAQRLARGAFHREALAWHVDHAEWQPVARAVAGQGALSTQQPSPPPPSRRDPDAPRPPPPAQNRSTQDKVARETQQLRELRERLSGSTAQIARSKATAAKEVAAGLGADAAKTAALMQQSVRRLLARLFDLTTLGIFAGAIGWGLANAIEPDGTLYSAPEPMALLWLGLFLWVPIEGALLGAAGTTPGKALLGLRVVSPTGGKPSLAAAWSRAVTVLWRGMGLGIPPLTVLGIVVGGVQTIQQGSAPWDRKLGLEVQAEPFDNRRWQIAIAGLVIALILLANGVWTSIAQQLAIGAGT